MACEHYVDPEAIAEGFTCVTLENGQWLHGVHPKHWCEGRACVIHGPSNHHMRDWPRQFRFDRNLMERVCPHGVGHPDPDDINPDHVHGCDGCCRG